MKENKNPLHIKHIKMEYRAYLFCLLFLQMPENKRAIQTTEKGANRC